MTNKTKEPFSSWFLVRILYQIGRGLGVIGGYGASI